MTQGSLDQTTREYSQDTETEVAISGHWSPNPAAEDLRLSQDALEVGDAIIWTESTQVKIGSRIRIQIDADGTIQHYRIKSLLHTYPVIGKLTGINRRKSWLLRKEVDA